MLTFIKLGGSLITDKNVENSFRTAQMQRIAEEIATALQRQTNLQVLIGHGSGSFGHFAAKRHGTINGVHTPEQWRGFAEVGTVAAALSYLVTQALSQAKVPVWRIQPSASARCEDGTLTYLHLHPFHVALSQGLVPLIHGDVALDTVRGGTIISTEVILSYLTGKLPVKRILLLGEVAGVYDQDGQIIPEITPQNLTKYRSALGGSAGTDVTGGMLSKVQEMLDLTARVPALEVRIMDGRQPDLLYQTLSGQAHPGTHIHQG